MNQDEKETRAKNKRKTLIKEALEAGVKPEILYEFLESLTLDELADLDIPAAIEELLRRTRPEAEPEPDGPKP